MIQEGVQVKKLKGRTATVTEGTFIKKGERGENVNCLKKNAAILLFHEIKYMMIQKKEKTKNVLEGGQL